MVPLPQLPLSVHSTEKIKHEGGPLLCYYSCYFATEIDYIVYDNFCEIKEKSSKSTFQCQLLKLSILLFIDGIEKTSCRRVGYHAPHATQPDRAKFGRNNQLVS